MIQSVDATALVDALLPTERHAAAITALRGHELWAPSIIVLEVASAVHRLHRTGDITGDEAERAVEDLHTAPLRLVPSESPLRDAWPLRTSLRISDAFYVAAARFLDSELLTSDARLTRAPNLGIRMVLLT